MCSRRDGARCRVRSLDGNLYSAGRPDFTDRGEAERRRTVRTPVQNIEMNIRERRSLPNPVICVQTSFWAAKNASRTKKQAKPVIGCMSPVLFG